MERGNISDADLFLTIDIPGFHAQMGAEEDNLFCIGRELSGLRVGRVDPEEKLQWIAGQNIDSTLVLRQQLISIRTETKMFDVAAQRIVESFAGEQTGEALGVTDAVVVEHCRLPALKLLGARG